MKKEEALAWFAGERSMTNIILQHPFETWEVRIAQADAAKMQEAYWVLKAHEDGLIPEQGEPKPETEETERGNDELDAQ